MDGGSQPGDHRARGARHCGRAGGTQAVRRLPARSCERASRGAGLMTITTTEILSALAATGETRKQWEARMLLEALDRAGYRIVKKPDLLEVGKPGTRPS